MRIRLSRLVLTCGLGILCAFQAHGAGLVISFDDGCHSWLKTAAPELARVGGRATAYVNNSCIHNADITVSEIRALQDKYGWEIGTHTYHHYDAPQFVQRRGLDTWRRDELDKALSELGAEGFSPRTLAFPFNSFNETLRRTAISRVASIRRYDRYPLSPGLNADGTFPATPIDMNHFVPANLLHAWIDRAAEKGLNVYLYGHAVLPDEMFVTGVATAVAAYTISASKPMERRLKGELCLVPDTTRRQSSTVKVDRIEGATVYAAKGDLRNFAKPGSEFLIGPCYGTRLSDFRRLLEYGRDRLPVVTVSQSLKKN
jgi:peptidoglycan/xylan/chitin deacetylase (PgdA/CDA1 family)